ncbi:MAG: hypothetical protein U9R34_01285 [Nanoarchaeota archaeon]|nr:hypothetical protein [Nanoarchaeota archaeon]
MRQIFNSIDKLKIKGTPKEEKEFEEYKDEVKRNFMEMDYVVRKKLKQLTRHHANTMNHNVMVAHDVKYIAKRLKLPEDEIQALFIAALVHDIGKLDVLDLLLDSKEKEQKEMLEIKRKENPNDLHLNGKKIIPIDVLSVEDLLKYYQKKKGLDEAKVRIFLKEKGIPLKWTLREYINVHQERTREILTKIGVNPKIVEYAASHHPEYFMEHTKLNWKCQIISIADKFNAMIQSEGVRNYMTKKNRIEALDIIIKGFINQVAESFFASGPKKIIRVLGEKYIPVEVKSFLIPYSLALIKAFRQDSRLSKPTIEELRNAIIDIEVTFEVNDKVKYVLDKHLQNNLKIIENELKKGLNIV